MPPASRSRQPDGGDTIKRNTAFALAAQLATAGFTAILTIFLVRYLGPDDFLLRPREGVVPPSALTPRPPARRRLRSACGRRRRRRRRA